MDMCAINRLGTWRSLVRRLIRTVRRPFVRQARENASGKACEAVSRAIELLLPLVPHPKALGVVGVEGDDGRDVSFAEEGVHFGCGCESHCFVVKKCSSVSDSRSLIATQHFDGKLRYKGQETRESPLVGKTMVFSAGKKKFDSGISQIGESFLGLASGSTHKHRCFSPPESEEAYSVSHQERTTEEPYRGPVQFAFVASDCEEVGWRVKVKQRWPDGL